MMKILYFFPFLMQVVSLNGLESNEVVLTASINKAQPTHYKPKNFYHLLGMKGFSDKLLTMHIELYQGYVNQTNLLQDKISSLSEANLVKSMELQALKKVFAFEYDGMKLHELYFENLGGKGGINPTTNLFKKMAVDFGSFEKWKADFMATGLFRGIGWVICYYDILENRLFNTWVESHEKGLFSQAVPILVMDCWEHAYLVDYGIKRADYIDAFMQNIQWNIPVNRFDLSSK